VIDGFEEAYPGVTVEGLDQPGEGYDDQVLSQAATGNLPDVTNLPPDFALPLAEQGILADISQLDDPVPIGVVERLANEAHFDVLEQSLELPLEPGVRKASR
jgi:multiple sugar transport system substrate-binding protein